MATLRDIRRKIRSVKDTQQITKAMKMVSAVKFMRAQKRLFEARPYSNKLTETIASLASRTDTSLHPLLNKRKTERTEIIILTADRGLCGSFNSNIIRKAEEFTHTKLDEYGVTLSTAGKKGRDYFRRKGYAIRREYINIFSSIEYSHAHDIGNDLIIQYEEEVFDEVYLIYNEFKSVIQQRIVIEPLLPITSLESNQDLIDFIYEPDTNFILKTLLPMYVIFQVYRALLESSAAEHAARMSAMGTATENCSEVVDKLTLIFNKTRQAAITKELLEVVSGAEALKE